MPKDSEIVISTGPIPGSKKVYVNAGKDGALRVPFREVKLEDSANEPPVRLYDTSGPYTADDVTIDVTAGIERIRESWISARGDVEEYEGREIKVEDNNRKEGDKDACPEFPAKHRPLRARDGAVVTQMAYARRGIITPEMEFVADRENLGRLGTPVRDGESFGASIPDVITPEFVRDEDRPRPRRHPPNINHPESEPMIIGRNFLVKINANIGNSAVTRRCAEEVEKMVWAPAGAPTRSWTCPRAKHPQHREWIIRNSAVADRHGADLPGAGEGRRRRRRPDLGDVSATR